jgi:hypothetical protein
MPRKPGIPKLRRFKPRNLGVVTPGGKTTYLGHWPADLAEPSQVVAHHPFFRPGKEPEDRGP